ncbi:MAG: hypothetical protein IJ196_08105 [Prevotella sp.]|nr:hypothetical protein [Prevotella sp.]
MKNVLKNLTGLLAGFVIGLAIAVLIIVLSGGDLAAFKSASDVESHRLLWAIVSSLLSLILAMMLNIMLHEAGHCLLGLLTGYRFVSYRVGSLTLLRDEQGRFHFRRYALAGTGGQCLMEPPARETGVPYLLYNAGGVLMNFMVAMGSMLVLSHHDLPMFWECFFMMMVMAGLLMGLTNAIPFSKSYINNDGRNILALWRHPELRKDFESQLRMAAKLTYGKRLSEMPAAWFDIHQAEGYADSITLAAQVNRIGWLEDQNLYEEARAYLEQVKAATPTVPALIQMEIDGEQVLLELITTGRKEVVDRLWTRQLQSYVKTAAKSSAGKQTILFAYELIYEGKEQQALDRFSSVKASLNRYAFPGEARAAIATMEWMLEEKSRQTAGQQYDL